MRDAARLESRTMRSAVLPLFVVEACVWSWTGGVPVQAQTYPVKPIRIISPFAAGGTNDVIARTVAPRLTDLLGQQVIVENRPGAGGVIGTELAAKSAPDGYTLTVATTATHAINAALRKLPYDPVKDFVPISLIGATAYVVIVHPSMPVRTVRELVALARARPGQIGFGSGGVGTPGHLAGEMLNVATGIQLQHVPYKAGNLALNDLIGGHVSLTFSTTVTSTQFMKAGRVRGIAVTSAQRLAAFPELPTVSESGVPGYECTLWLGLAAPAGTPDAIVQRLYDAVSKAVQTEAVRNMLIAQSVEPATLTPAAFAKRIAGELINYARVVKQIGASVN